MSQSPDFKHRFDAWVAAVQAFGPILSNDPVDLDALNRHRAHYERVLAMNPAPEGVTIADIDLNGVPGLAITPSQVRGDRTMLYLHGGGYMSGTPRGYVSLGGLYAQLLGARVVLPHYRLAPEHPYPAPIDDCLAAYRFLLDTGRSGRNIVFSGDSAGGALVVSLMVRARDAGLALPAGGAAISPWSNLVHTGASMRTRDGLDPQGDLGGMNLLARTFLAGEVPTVPDASPVFADLRGLPPILVQIGENEVLLNDAVRLAEQLGEARVRVTLEIWPRMFHAWHMFASVLPEGREALENAAGFLDRAFARAAA